LDRSEQDRGMTQSREYTSVILKDTSRRIMQKIHAAEKLECFEVLIEIWQINGVRILGKFLMAGENCFRFGI